MALLGCAVPLSAGPSRAGAGLEGTLPQAGEAEPGGSWRRGEVRGRDSARRDSTPELTGSSKDGWSLRQLRDLAGVKRPADAGPEQLPLPREKA